MDASDYQKIRQLFDDYLRMYSSRDDRLTTYFSEDFSGFTGGGDFLVKDREEWVAITRQDFAQVKDPIRIELKDLAIQSLADTIAVATGFFTIHLPIEDHILSRETARLVLIFRKESAGWKISHSSISIPYYLVREGEVYPLKELVDRNQFLEELVAERTIQLSEANEKLQQTNEELAREIAKHKQAEEALKESEFFFKESQRSASIGSYKTDFVTGNWKSSEVLDTIFGIDKSFNRNVQGWLDIVHPDDRDMMDQYLSEEVISNRNPFAKEYRIIRQNDGETRWVNGLGEAHFDSNGNILSLIGTIQDITERKELENKQLKIDKLESLGLLAGGIAHDFNNILTGIMGNISFAQKFLDVTHKSYKPLAEAEKASVRAGELAHQFLTFARGGEPVKKVVSLRNLVNETVSLVLSGSNVKGAIDIPDSIHAIEADEGQMNQVFHNLIINATQAMPGGGTLNVTAQNVTLPNANTINLPGGSYVKLAFADQGCGISAGDLKRIFDPYFTTKSTGSGLGLASVHSIVNRHGGHIGVISAPGNGTTFTIHLPSIGETYSKDETYSVAQTSGVHSDGSILVMDDEEIIREMTTEILEYLGYQVTTCENGAEAIALYKAARDSGAPFSAVIMDLTIPGGMGGKEAAKQILAIDPKGCLIVSSGYSNDPIMSEYSAHGFNGAIAKPYNMTEFEQLLTSMLSAQ